MDKTQKNNQTGSREKTASPAKGLHRQTDEAGEARGALAYEKEIRPLWATFRHILLVVFLIFVFAVVQMFTLWQVCKTGMKTAASLEHQGLPALNELASLQEHLAIYRLDSYEYLFAQQGEKAGKAKAVQDTAVQTRAELENIKTLLPEGEGRNLASNLENAFNDLDTEFRKVQNLEDSDFAAAMKAMDQNIPPLTERVTAAANAFSDYGYHFSGGQASATFASFGWIKNNAILFGIANIAVAFGAVMFVLLAARRSRTQLSHTLAQVEERTGELADSQALYHSLVDQLPAGVFRKDAEGRFVFVNSWYCRIKGMTPEQILGKTSRELAASEFANHPEAAKEIQLAIQGAINHQWIMETGKRIDVEEQYPSVDGKIQYWQVVKSPVFGSDGKIIGTQGIFFDITEHRQADAALAQERNLLRTMIDNSPDTIYIKDLAGRKTLANLAELKNMGCQTEAEAIGKSDFEIYPEELAAGYFADDQAVIQTGQPLINHEEKIVTAAGETHWSLSSKIPLRDATGTIIGLVGMGRDITERKRIEAQLLQSQKMETVGKLAGGFAHEFNSILTAIIGQSELLLGDLPAGSPLVKNANEINRAASRAAALTRQLLAYGRKQFLQPEALDLNQVIAGMEGMLRHLMGGDVNAQIVPASDLHMVKVDAGQIEQVIINMAINARDAMPNGGKLILETANVSFDEESVGRYPELKPGDYVMLAITDTGTGMSDEVKARVFEPFFSTKDVGQGTGLGLSTCYGIIKQSGGHISIYSEPGRGTTFKIYLPQMESEAKIPILRLGSPDLPHGTETILLVEDDPALREMAATLLRRLGYTVLTAANGVEALNLKQQRDTGYIDLLFTDVVMPHMSGKELADRLRALRPQTKILFTSAYTENAIVHQGVLDKGVALLQKPFTPSALANKVREVLDQPGAAKPV